SCNTGQPLANVNLDVFGEDAGALQSAQTNESGVALLPRSMTQRHLRASLGQDSMIIDFDSSIPTVSMWRFPVNTEWDPQLPDKRTALLFTDRTLYRPGEEVHLKGIVRRIKNNRSIFDTGKGAQLVIQDSSGRTLEERDITLSDKGSFDHSFTLPAQTVGYFSLELLWPDEIAATEEMDNWHTRAAHRNSARFVHNIAVQEFRRNAFETKAGFVDSGSNDKVTLSLKANYFQGQPVAEAAVEWFYRSREAGFYPTQFRDYLFCDHRSYDAYYWSHYFGYGEGSYRRSFGTRNGTANLDQDGFASLTFDLAEIDFPSPRTVSVTSEIRDQRNQTLSADANTTVHSSDYYVGLSRLDKLVRVGDETGLRAVAVSADGKPLTGDPVEFTLRIEREIHEQIKTRTASGTIAVRNEKRIETIIENQPFRINPAEAAGGGSILPFKPEHAGKYILTLSGSDPKGRPIRTAVTQRVYGSKEYPWAYENGMLIKLVPEKKRYRPGETARILVQSPIEGTALVTLEREGVHRHMLKKITAENPVVEIPLTDEDAPNAFVSVLVIKGSQDNLRAHKEPILRLGYCELAVEVVKERLQVALKIPGDYHRPGEEVTIEGLVRDHAGNPVSGAEITVYAEDEGTLAVAGYPNPDPVAHFYAPRSLRTEAGTSLGKILSEDPGQHHTFNKGFFIGGGGADEFGGLGEPKLRKDFSPCAVWMPVLATTGDGRFKVQFTSPDTLTRYRVIAVAHHGSTHFGREISEFTVKK
ncbi:MAG: MG2 domain-containing protein, partial [Roseibacillus sp.]|nr:MG2 domain-containing protein [Roseibacillus sp.]